MATPNNVVEENHSTIIPHDKSPNDWTGDVSAVRRHRSGATLAVMWIVLHWNGQAPLELQHLPAGRYVPEPIDEASEPTRELEDGVQAAPESPAAGQPREPRGSEGRDRSDS